MPRAKVTSKGQITIPVEVRKALGLEVGDEVEFISDGRGRYSLRPRNGSIRDLEGCVPNLGWVPTVEQMNDALLEEAAESYLQGVARPELDRAQGEAA